MWIARFKDGTIQTLANTKQETTDEWLPDDHPEVVAEEQKRANPQPVVCTAKASPPEASSGENA